MSQRCLVAANALKYSLNIQYMKILKKLLVGLGLLLCVPQDADAVKAYPRPVTITQPDGTKITVRIHGDESFHYTTTIDGFMLEMDKAGFFRYVDYDFKTGKKTLSALRARNVGERTAEEKTFVANLKAATLITADMKTRRPLTLKQPGRTVRPWLEKQSAAKANAANAAAARTVSGDCEYLVILVNFADSTFKYKNEDFETWLNEPGYSTNGGTGSVKDYWRDNSMGQFVPNFTVVGPYTLSKPLVAYAGNAEDTGEDIDPRSMIKEACQLAKEANPGLDFSKFDNDGDGVVDNCYVIYAGYSEASTANPNDMWPHSWTMGDDVFEIDGVKIDEYSCSAELVGMPGAPAVPTMDGIGTFTHEFGHILGLKDMYDTDDYTNGYGVDPGAYSLYASGSYNNDSRTPPCLMAFERLQMGWAKEGTDIVELKNAEDVTLDNVATNKARYINAQPDREPGTGYEWFVLENRQKTGWDSYIPAHGLLIYHYDYTQEMVDEYWSVNGPNNNANHRCMYIKAADGVDDENSRAGDTYPGTSANTEFTDTSTPNSLNWSNEPVNVPVTNIIEQDGIIRFQVGGGASTWDFVKTNVPTDIRDVSATFTAEMSGNTAEVTETGFCWSLEENPTVEGEHKTAAMADGKFSAAVDNLQPGSNYNVRAYARMSDGTVNYGSAILFTTECATASAPFIADFLSWTNGQPDCWQIVDRNGDGTTWILDESTGGLVYQFNYWNNADDWLISKRRIHVPENGVLFFSRGVAETTTVEDLEIYVSTKTSDIDDFYLYERLSFADYFGEQHIEEVDLSRFAGQDIYIAFRCCSEKLQTNLWIWNVAVTEKLPAPTITTFDQTAPDQLFVEWTPVEKAKNYYLYFGKETDEPNEVLVFAPMDFFEKTEGDVQLSTGSMFFTGDATVELKEFPEGITDLKFMLTTSGPTGTSTLLVEGTKDGTTWTSVGQRLTLSEYDNEGQECDWLSYVQDQGFKKLRFRFTHGGRNGRVRYLTLGYTDGKIVEDLSGGGTWDEETGILHNSMVIKAVTPGEFNNGRYVVWVASGDGNFFYDQSENAYYEYGGPSSITETIGESGISVTAGEGYLGIDGLKPGYRITCASPSGALLYSGEADGQHADIRLDGQRGIVLVSIEGDGQTYRTKVIVR